MYSGCVILQIIDRKSIISYKCTKVPPKINAKKAEFTLCLSGNLFVFQHLIQQLGSVSHTASA